MPVVHVSSIETAHLLPVKPIRHIALAPLLLTRRLWSAFKRREQEHAKHRLACNGLAAQPCGFYCVFQIGSVALRGLLLGACRSQETVVLGPSALGGTLSSYDPDDALPSHCEVGSSPPALLPDVEPSGGTR